MPPIPPPPIGMMPNGMGTMPTDFNSSMANQSGESWYGAQGQTQGQASANGAWYDTQSQGNANGMMPQASYGNQNAMYGNPNMNGMNGQSAPSGMSFYKGRYVPTWALATWYPPTTGQNQTNPAANTANGANPWYGTNGQTQQTNPGQTQNPAIPTIPGQPAQQAIAQGLRKLLTDDLNGDKQPEAIYIADQDIGVVKKGTLLVQDTKTSQLGELAPYYVQNYGNEDFNHDGLKETTVNVNGTYYKQIALKDSQETLQQMFGEGTYVPIASGDMNGDTTQEARYLHAGANGAADRLVYQSSYKLKGDLTPQMKEMKAAVDAIEAAKKAGDAAAADKKVQIGSFLCQIKYKQEGDQMIVYVTGLQPIAPAKPPETTATVQSPATQTAAKP